MTCTEQGIIFKGIKEAPSFHIFQTLLKDNRNAVLKNKIYIAKWINFMSTSK